MVAAVELADELRTDHAVYILPCRDPIGLSGFNHAISLGLGQPLPAESAPQSIGDAAALLREKGQVLHDSGGRLVATLDGGGVEHAYSVCEGCVVPDCNSGHQPVLAGWGWLLSQTATRGTSQCLLAGADAPN